MKKFAHPHQVCFDIDDTVVEWSSTSDAPRIDILAPWGTEYLTPNHEMITQLKKDHCCKRYVIVWSQAGADWAEAVIRALELTNYVDEVRTKPMRYYDDLPADEWMQRVLPDGTRRGKVPGHAIDVEEG